MKYQRETLTKSICDELWPLLWKHYNEIAHYQDIPLDPDFDQYLRIEDAGMLRFFSARSESGQLLGYAIFFVRPNLHYKTSKQAVQDIIFLHPDHRNAGFGASLISFCDDELRNESCQVSYHHVKTAHNFGPLLEKLGYKLIDQIYGRRLDS